ncbi:peptide chain release factor 1 [soil metagenome]
MDEPLTERLAEVEEAFRAVSAELNEAAVSDPANMAGLGRRHSELAAIVDLIERWRRTVTDHEEALELASDDPSLAPELRRLAAERRMEADNLEKELRRAMIPADPNDHRDVILEVRAAAGGDEAAIWAGDLLRMFEKFAERGGYRVESIDTSPSQSGGFSRVTVGVKGAGAFSRFKYEAGVHRVQRVPKTESQGRVHTSTATVAVLPEAEAVEVEIDPGDVKVDVYRSQGPGGQSVNTTDSAVRLTHHPSGLVVSVQDEKSQLQNKEKAYRILRARLLALHQAEQAAEVAGERRSQVGSGDRSEKIRTYNFKENRVTDHRIGLTSRRLDQVLEGALDEIVDALSAAEQADRLSRPS